MTDLYPSETLTSSQNDFARGFLISESGTETEVPAWWTTQQFGPLQIQYDPRVSLALSTAKPNIAILGHAIDVFDGTANLPDIAKKLSSVLNDDPASFQRAVDRLSGWFVILHVDAAGVHIQQDAVGMRSMFFTKSHCRPVVGSHESLVASQIDSRPSIFARANNSVVAQMGVMPGRATRAEDVLALTPNTSLEIFSRRTSRVFSGAHIKPLTVSAAARYLTDHSRAQLPGLVDFGPLRSSLSAGLDSRVTAALLRPIVDHIEFFTYELTYKARTKASMYDRPAAVKLAAQTGMRHSVIKIASTEIDDSLTRTLKEISARPHSRSLANAYLQNFPDGLHIRSNVYEIGRSYYHGTGFPDVPMTAAGMLTVVSKNKSGDSNAIAAFEEFIEATDFNSATNIDPLDLFYWEHRMGRWMTPVIAESDIAHETHVLVNNRLSLEAMLGVPAADRLNGTVLDEVISREWPELYAVPVNGYTRHPRSDG